MAWKPYQPAPLAPPSPPRAGPYIQPGTGTGFGNTSVGAGPVTNPNGNPNSPRVKQQWTSSSYMPSMNNGFGNQRVAGATAVQQNTTGVPYANLNSTMYRGGMIGTQQQPLNPTPATPTPTTPTGYDMHNPATWWWLQPSANGIVQQNGITYNQNAIPGGRNLPPGGEYTMQSGLVGVMPYQQGGGMGHGSFGGGSPFGGGQDQRPRGQRYGY